MCFRIIIPKNNIKKNTININTNKKIKGIKKKYNIETPSHKILYKYTKHKNS